jgi:hypothetical protein
VAQKLKDYIERTISLNVRYRLDLGGDQLYKKRLRAELERSKTIASLKTISKTEKDISDLL